MPRVKLDTLPTTTWALFDPKLLARASRLDDRGCKSLRFVWSVNKAPTPSTHFIWFFHELCSTLH